MVCAGGCSEEDNGDKQGQVARRRTLQALGAVNGVKIEAPEMCGLTNHLAGHGEVGEGDDLNQAAQQEGEDGQQNMEVGGWVERRQGHGAGAHEDDKIPDA